jgi:hypothetical protein
VTVEGQATELKLESLVRSALAGSGALTAVHDVPDSVTRTAAFVEAWAKPTATQVVGEGQATEVMTGLATEEATSAGVQEVPDPVTAISPSPEPPA